MSDTPPGEKERHPDGIWVRDSNGEYRVARGNRYPENGCCNGVLQGSLQRYGEKRFCARRKGCQHHRGAWALHEFREETHQMSEKWDAYTQAWVENYRRIINQMPAHKKLSAIRLFKSFRKLSVHDFGGDEKEIDINTERVDWTDEDNVTVTIPVPDEKRSAQENALFMAACDFVRMQNINEALFEDAFQADDDARMGEKEIPLTSDGELVTDDSGNPETRTEEHHLNLVQSRISKDFESYLEFGGVLDEKDVDVTVDSRNFDIDLGPSEDEASPPEGRTPEKYRVDDDLELE